METSLAFSPAVRRNTPVIIVLAGASGSGKTWSALELAQGLKGGGKVALIDTEGNRALLYADYFEFDHCELRAPYSPRRFLEALTAAEAQGYSVVIVDSFSDSYVGDGGMVDMAAEEEKRVKNSAAAWAKPKAENKLVVRWFRQSRCHVVLALRAEEKVKLEKVIRDNGREQTIVVPIGFQMISEKNLPFEATMSMMLKPDAPGVPNPVKLPEQFRPFFPDGKPITRESGRQLAAWCAGAPAPALPAKPVFTVVDGDGNGVDYEDWRDAGKALAEMFKAAASPEELQASCDRNVATLMQFAPGPRARLANVITATKAIFAANPVEARTAPEPFEAHTTPPEPETATTRPAAEPATTH